MKRLTNEEVRVDESVDKYLGPLVDLEGMKPKLLDLILNGPALNGVSKDVLRQIIRQLYSALAAYENTGITAEEITATASLPMFVKVASAALGTTPDHLRELVDADKEGRMIALPIRPVLRPDISNTLYIIEDGEIHEDWLCGGELGMSESGVTNAIYTTLERQMSFEQADIGKTVFLTREAAEKALEDATC